jgi:hypothetical protein
MLPNGLANCQAISRVSFDNAVWHVYNEKSQNPRSRVN